MIQLRILLVIFIGTTYACFAQNVYKAKDGNVKFFSDAPLEDIEATSKKGSAAFNIASSEIAALVPIKSFTFQNALMQEHFNENYLESEKYPNASFKGKVAEQVIPEPGSSKTIDVAGDLTIHGVTKKRTIPVTFKFGNDGSIQVTSKWMVALADHNIKIPQLVFQNIAEQIEVTLDLNLSLPHEK